MKIDPYANGGHLRPQLEGLTREQLTELTYEAVAELSRRALRQQDVTESERKNKDHAQRGRIGW